MEGEPTEMEMEIEIERQKIETYWNIWEYVVKYYRNLYISFFYITAMKMVQKLIYEIANPPCSMAAVSPNEFEP